MTPGVDFQLSDHEVDPETHLIELGGEIDLYTAPGFEERLAALLEDGKRRIVINLLEVTFIDSTGVHVIVNALQRLQGVGGALALVCVNENVLQVFKIIGLDTLLPIHGTREEGLAAVAENA
jgi:anti-sigma B factor antagonist